MKTLDFERQHEVVQVLAYALIQQHELMEAGVLDKEAARQSMRAAAQGTANAAAPQTGPDMPSRPSLQNRSRCSGRRRRITEGAHPHGSRREQHPAQQRPRPQLPRVRGRARRPAPRLDAYTYCELIPKGTRKAIPMPSGGELHQPDGQLVPVAPHSWVVELPSGWLVSIDAEEVADHWEFESGPRRVPRRAAGHPRLRQGRPGAPQGQTRRSASSTSPSSITPTATRPPRPASAR